MAKAIRKEEIKKVKQISNDSFQVDQVFLTVQTRPCTLAKSVWRKMEKKKKWKAKKKNLLNMLSYTVLKNSTNFISSVTFNTFSLYWIQVTPYLIVRSSAINPILFFYLSKLPILINFRQFPLSQLNVLLENFALKCIMTRNHCIASFVLGKYIVCSIH